MFDSLPFRRGGTSPLSISILGVGNIGRVHLKSGLAMDGVEVTAVADAVPENRDRAKRAGVETVYDDYEALLEAEGDRLDAAVVALPPFLHRDAVECAADASVDVFVEKPLARSTEEADAMLDAAERAGIRVGVDHTLRYQPDMAGVVAAYREGRVGHVPYASMTRLNDFPLGGPPATAPPPAWALDPEAAGGGTVLELGVHCFDLLEHLFGRLEVRDAVVDRTLDVPIEDAATVTMRAPETETTVTLHLGGYQWEELPEVNTRLRLEGITGTIENAEHLPKNFYASAARSALSNVAGRLTRSAPDVFGPTFYLQAHYDALADFVTAVRAEEQPPIDGADGRRTLELVERVYELADANRPEADVLEVTT